MKFYRRIFGLLIFGIAAIFPHKHTPGFATAQHATTVPTTAEVEFEAEETTVGPSTTTTPSPTTTAAPRAPTQAPVSHRGQPAFLARHQAQQTAPPPPRAVGTNCPTYKYTIDKNTVEFHTVPGSCKIVVQYPKQRRGGKGGLGSRGPPRVQYMARLP